MQFLTKKQDNRFSQKKTTNIITSQQYKTFAIPLNLKENTERTRMLA